MLDSEGFVLAGWVHDLKLYSFEIDSTPRFLVMGKVRWTNLYKLAVFSLWIR